MFFTNTLMFFKNIRLIKKNIRSFVDEGTVDCLQTYGPLFTNSYRLQTIDRMVLFFSFAKDKGGCSECNDSSVFNTNAVFIA